MKASGTAIPFALTKFKSGKIIEGFIIWGSVQNVAGLFYLLISRTEDK